MNLAAVYISMQIYAHNACTLTSHFSISNSAESYTENQKTSPFSVLFL